MKVKDYVEMYQKEEDKDKVIIQISLSFMKELKQIIEERNCQRNSACISVFKEQEQKWKALSKKIPLNPEGFKIICKNLDGLKEIYPLIWTN